MVAFPSPAAPDERPERAHAPVQEACEELAVSDLLLRHCTGMARRVRPRRSIATVSVDNSELFACFLHGGVRTFGSLVRHARALRGVGRSWGRRPGGL